MTKFNKIIMNPPYDKNLHLKILREAMKHSDEIVNLSPIRWLQDPLAEYKRGSDWHKFEDVRERIADLEVISLEDMSKMFGGIDVSGGIYYLTKDGGFDISKVRSVFLDKFVKMDYDTVGHHLDKDKLDGWRVRCGSYGGTFKGSTRLSSDSVRLACQNYVHFKLDRIYKDGYTLDGIFWSYDRLPGAGNKIKPEGTPIPSSISFSDYEYAKNFVDYTRLKLPKYICQLCSDFGGNSDDLLPFMPTYSHPWTDADLFEYFSLTPEEIKEIKNAIR